MTYAVPYMAYGMLPSMEKTTVYLDPEVARPSGTTEPVDDGASTDDEVHSAPPRRSEHSDRLVAPREGLV